jgi:hypothetical protein
MRSALAWKCRGRQLPLEAGSTPSEATLIGPLRQRMIDVMRVAKFGEQTYKHYIR